MLEPINYKPGHLLSDASYLDKEISYLKGCFAISLAAQKPVAASNFIERLIDAKIKRVSASEDDSPIEIKDLEWYRIDDPKDDDGRYKIIDRQDMGPTSFLWPGLRFNSGGTVCAQDMRESFDNGDFANMVQSLEFDPNRTRTNFPMFMHQIAHEGWLFVYLRSTDRWHVVKEHNGGLTNMNRVVMDKQPASRRP